LVGDEFVAGLDVFLGWGALVLGGLDWGLGGLAVGAASGDGLGVGVEEAAVGVEEVFLFGDELVAGSDVVGGGPGFAGFAVPGTSAGRRGC